MWGINPSTGAARGDGAAEDSRGRAIPTARSARGSKCQAINNQPKGNNRIQWRTINKIPLV